MNNVYVWPKGLKKTQPRQRVLSILADAEKPLSAREIADRAAEPGKKSWFSTVYRCLQSFCEHGLVEETTVAGSDVRLYELVRDEHQHYARCDACHKIIPVAVCPLEHLIEAVRDFRITGHRLELTGICRACDGNITGRGKRPEGK